MSCMHCEWGMGRAPFLRWSWCLLTDGGAQKRVQRWEVLSAIMLAYLSSSFRLRVCCYVYPEVAKNEAFEVMPNSAIAHQRVLS